MVKSACIFHQFFHGSRTRLELKVLLILLEKQAYELNIFVEFGLKTPKMPAFSTNFSMGAGHPAGSVQGTGSLLVGEAQDGAKQRARSHSYVYVEASRKSRNRTWGGRSAPPVWGKFALMQSQNVCPGEGASDSDLTILFSNSTCSPTSEIPQLVPLLCNRTGGGLAYLVCICGCSGLWRTPDGVPSMGIAGFGQAVAVAVVPGAGKP